MNPRSFSGNPNQVPTTAAYQASQAAQAIANQAVTAQQQFIINSFKGQIYISNSLDVEDTPLYDTITYIAGDTINSQNSAWWTNIGNNSGKTDAQTNMTQEGKLDAPEAFSVFGIRLGWSEDIYYPDMISLLNTWDYQLKLAKKVYSQANIRHYSSGWGVSGYTTQSAQSFYTNGMAARNSMNMVSVKLVIANQQSFSAYLSGAATGSQTLSADGTGLIMINEFVGLYARGVQ
jgi:hypothetical protein